MTTFSDKRRLPASSAPATERGRAGAPELILAIALALSLVASIYVAHTTQAAEKLQFSSLVEQTNDSIEQHIGIYAALLNGARGLLAARNDPDTPIDHAAFRAYVDQLGGPMRDPGIAGIGYIYRVPPGGEASLTATMRAQGRPDFHLWDPADSTGTVKPRTTTDERFAVLYLEPAATNNQTGVGLDTHREPVRRAAMDEARDTGLAVASGRVVSLRPTVATANNPIFIIFLPVYAGNATPASPNARRADLRSFVYCPFHSDEMLQHTLNGKDDHRLNIDVFDGTTLDDANLLYRSRAASGDTVRRNGSKASNDETDGSELYDRRKLNIVGRTWTVVCRPGASFGETQWAPYVLIAGVAISGLMYGIAKAQSRARNDAVRATGFLQRSDAALRSSEARARRLIESNIIGVLRADFAGRVVEANDALLQLSGWTREELEAGKVTLAALTPPEMTRNLERMLQKMHGSAASQPPFEAVLLRRDGERVPVTLGATRVEVGDGREAGESNDQFIAFLLDISERKNAERQIRDNEARQRAFFRDVLSSVTEGRLRLCDSPADLPPRADADATVVNLTKPTLRIVRRAAQNAADVADMPVERSQDMITAVGEAVMNAVVHAGGGVATVSTGQNGTVQVWIEDHGTGIDMQRLPKATLERGFTTAGSLGHGFWLMLKTVDRLWLLTGPQGTTVVIEQDAVLAEPSWIADRTGAGMAEMAGIGETEGLLVR